MKPLPFVFFFSGGPLEGSRLAGDASHEPALAGFGSIAYRDTNEGRIGSALDVVYPATDSLTASSTVRFVVHRYVVSHRTTAADGRLQIHAQYFGPMNSPRDAGTDILEDKPRKSAAIAVRRSRS
jgi:hypothetical protein